MSKVTIVAPEATLVSPRPESLRADAAVAVADDVIAAVDPLATLRTRWPDATVVALPGCLAMPGLVNAHQHGRGISQIQLGYPDDFLELWIHRRRGRGVLDAYPITKLAAANMVANGVTTTIHANFSYGSGDYEAEVRASLRAYDEVGIRVTMCIGAMDRGALVYPPHEACFLRGLPAEINGWLGRPRPPAYAGDGPATVALMERLLADYRGHPRIRLCYGPAGPQWVTDDLLRHLVRDADRKGLGIHLHALESPAQAAVAAELYPEGVFRRLEKLGALTPRTVLAHGVWVTEADMEIIAAAGAIVVRNAGCNLRLRNGIAPVAQYLRHGVRVAIGTDNASLADDEDLLKELRLTHLLAMASDWSGAEPPSPSDLLVMAVTNGVAAAQLVDGIGTLEPGAKADLVAISLERVRSPYLDPDMPLIEALLARATGSDVCLTMVDGRIVYEGGRHRLVDLGETEAAAAATARAARVSRDGNARSRTAALTPHLVAHYRALGRTKKSD